MLRYFKGLIISLMTLAAIACHSPVLHRKAKDLSEKPSSVANDKTGKVSSVLNANKSDSVATKTASQSVNAAIIDPAIIAAAPVNVGDAVNDPGIAAAGVANLLGIGDAANPAAEPVVGVGVGVNDPGIAADPVVGDTVNDPGIAANPVNAGVAAPVVGIAENPAAEPVVVADPVNPVGVGDANPAVGIGDAVNNPAAEPVVGVNDPVEAIEPVLSRELLVKNLKDLETHEPTADTMQAVSQLLETETGHRNFFHPFTTKSVDYRDGLWGVRESGDGEARYEVQLLNMTSEGAQEIRADVNLSRKENRKGFNVYNYNYQNYQSSADAPIVRGNVYGIQNKSNRTIELLGFLRIETHNNSQEYIHLTFGKTDGMIDGNSIIKNNVVIDANNVPLKGIFSVQHHKGAVKTYDFENLSDDDKVALKALKIFSDIN